MTRVPTPAELANIADEELQALATAWRLRALHGDKAAYGVAHALEVEWRGRLRASQLAQLPPEPASTPRPWWRFWQARGDTAHDPLSPT